MKRSQEALFIFLLLIQLVLYACGNIILGTQFTDIGALFVVCVICAPELYLAHRAGPETARLVMREPVAQLEQV